MSIAVIAGTPVDTRMGVDLIKGRGGEAQGFPVSQTPEEQTAFQVGSQSAREEAVGAILDRIKDRGMDRVLVYCNSLSATIDARALAGDPSVILADEPTGALDSRTGREVLHFLKQLHEEGNKVVLITHDNSIAVKAERIVRLQDGKIIYDGDAHDPQAVVQPHLDDEDEEVTA